MRRARLIVAIAIATLCVAAAAARPEIASPGASATKASSTCDMPSSAPLWIDYADASVPFWQQVFARPGIIGAGSSPTALPQLRAAGASTVYFDLYMKYRVGTLASPLDTETVIAKSNELFDLAVMRTGCPAPRIAENELFSANFPAPWSAEAAQYRANVLTMVQTLASRGAQTYLLVSKPPASDSTAAAWWRQLATASSFVTEVYFPAPQIYALGPAAGSRRLRVAFRRAIANFAALGIPASKLGIMLGFQVAPGVGGRENLQPDSAWFRVVKWQALAAEQIAREAPIDSIWSWGWGTWSDEGSDPDKPAAACVYLWTRSPLLCDALSLVGPDFNPSLTEGQIDLPLGTRCLVDTKPLRDAEVAALARLTGDADAAFSALFARTVESGLASVSPARVLATERAIIRLRFKSSGASYRRALARAGASPAMARAIIADGLRRRSIATTLPVANPSASAIKEYYESRRSEAVRLVRAEPAPDWLGGRRQGYALASLAPKALFVLRDGSKQRLRTLLGDVRVTALAPATTLGSLPLAVVRSAIRIALIESARDDAFVKWTVAQQAKALGSSNCTLDQTPLPSSVELSSYLPFLSLQDGYSPAGKAKTS